MSSDCVNYIPGHIDTKYLDQASWIYDRMAASQRLKLSCPQQWNRPLFFLQKFVLTLQTSLFLLDKKYNISDNLK